MPTFFSSSSTPPYLLRFQAPFLRASLAGAMLRAQASSRPTASSAALVMLEVGAFTTMTPALVAVSTSTLSRPTPARAMTLRFFEAAMASASIFVADRMSTASTSARAGSRAARSAPSTWRTSKSGPRASRVAGESSSAMRTTGLVTKGPSFGAAVGHQPVGRMPVPRVGRAPHRSGGRALRHAAGPGLHLRGVPACGRQRPRCGRRPVPMHARPRRRGGGRGEATRTGPGLPGPRVASPRRGRDAGQRAAEPST